MEVVWKQQSYKEQSTQKKLHGVFYIEDALRILNFEGINKWLWTDKHN